MPTSAETRDEPWTMMNSRHLRFKMHRSWCVCHHVFPLPRSHIDRNNITSPCFKGKCILHCICFGWCQVAMIAAWELFSFALFWLKSGNTSTLAHFLKHYGPKPLGAGGLSSLWGGHSTQQPPAGMPTNVRVLLAFSEARLLSELWISCRATIYVSIVISSETERNTAATLDEEPMGRVHIQSERPSRIIQFSCNQKEWRERERKSPPHYFCTSIWGRVACC